MCLKQHAPLLMEYLMVVRGCVINAQRSSYSTMGSPIVILRIVILSGSYRTISLHPPRAPLRIIYNNCDIYVHLWALHLECNCG